MKGIKFFIHPLVVGFFIKLCFATGPGRPQHPAVWREIAYSAHAEDYQLKRDFGKAYRVLLNLDGEGNRGRLYIYGPVGKINEAKKYLAQVAKDKPYLITFLPYKKLYRGRKTKN